MNGVLTVGSLFAGIGGFDLGLERAGMRVVWQCEQDPFCRRVLARHWPGVPCHPDVRALVADTDSLAGESARRDVGRGRAVVAAVEGEQEPRRAGSTPGADAGSERAVPVPVPYVDVLCGGFPCQDISLAGRGAGLAGERSGLWREFARLIGELRPRYVIVENVPALTSRGLSVVLGDLAACGFDAEWDHLPASAFGAPHRRDRIWLVAYPDAERLRARRDDAGQSQVAEPFDRSSSVAAQLADPARHGAGQPAPAGTVGQRARASSEPAGALGDSARRRRDAVSDSGSSEREGRQSAWPTRGRSSDCRGEGWWFAEPDVGRVAHGIPQRVDRLRALGNSLVPQIAEWIGRQILEWERLSP